MKKAYVVIAVAAILIALLGMKVFRSGYERANFTGEFAKYIAQALERGTLAAEYNGERYPLGSEYADRLLRVLRRGQSDLKFTSGAPETYEDSLTLYMGDMTIRVYQAKIDVDEVVMAREKNGKTVYKALNGYRALEWLKYTLGITNEI